MEQRASRLYPTAPLKEKLFRTEIRKKLNVVSSFENSINNINEMITFFKVENKKWQKKYKIYKTLTSKLESVHTVGATTTSLTWSVTGVGLIVVPVSAGTACTLSSGKKVLHKNIMNK